MHETTNKRRSRSDRTYHTILDVAFQLFLSTGIERTSIKQIADRAGVHRSTVYRYFDSREDIGYAIQDRIAERVGTDGVHFLPETGTGWERLAAFMRFNNDIVRTNRDSVRFFALFGAYTAVSDDQAKLIQHLRAVFHIDESVATLVTLIRQGIDDRSIRNDIDVRRIAASLWLSFSAVWYRIVIRNSVLQFPLDIEDPDRIAHDTLEILLDGLKMHSRLSHTEQGR